MRASGGERANFEQRKITFMDPSRTNAPTRGLMTGRVKGEAHRRDRPGEYHVICPGVGGIVRFCRSHLPRVFVDYISVVVQSLILFK